MLKFEQLFVLIMVGMTLFVPLVVGQTVDGSFALTPLASGDLLDQPKGIEFNDSGELLVANETSSGVDGNILRITSAGEQSIFSSANDLFLGPLEVALSPGGAFGPAGELLVGIEDRNDQQMFPSDGITKVTDDGTPVLFALDLEEPNGLEFAKGSGFGNNLFVASRSAVHQPGMDFPSKLFEINSTGVKSEFTIMQGADEITGVIGFEFGPGGAFGTDLYLSTFDDDDSIDPTAIDAIYRVDSNGSATQLVAGTRFVYAEFSDDAAFGEYLYFSDFTRLKRIDPNGNIEVVGEGFGNLRGLAFSSDGCLFAADSVLATIYQITPISGLLGDVNGDGVVNLLDVAPFVGAISTGTFIPAADINQDGVVNLLDVEPFVDLLSG